MWKRFPEAAAGKAEVCKGFCGKCTRYFTECRPAAQPVSYSEAVLDGRKCSNISYIVRFFMKALITCCFLGVVRLDRSGDLVQEHDKGDGTDRKDEEEMARFSEKAV